MQCTHFIKTTAVGKPRSVKVCNAPLNKVAVAYGNLGGATAFYHTKRPNRKNNLVFWGYQFSVLGYRIKTGPLFNQFSKNIRLLFKIRSAHSRSTFSQTQSTHGLRSKCHRRYCRPPLQKYSCRILKYRSC